MKVGLAFQENCAVLHLLDGLRVLIEMANMGGSCGGIVASDLVLRTGIAQSNRARARQVTQRVPFDLTRLSAQAVGWPLQPEDKFVTKIRNQRFSCARTTSR